MSQLAVHLKDLVRSMDSLISRLFDEQGEARPDPDGESSFKIHGIAGVECSHADVTVMLVQPCESP
jgi:hypothetical protein